MDSVTQLALGAAIGEAVLGRKVGYRAVLWGGVCGTLPDLDVFISFADAVAEFTYHRSFSHSLFVLTLLTPIVVWLILKIHPQTIEHKRGWWKLVLLALLTHPLLDSLTVYGTQIFWPLITTPVTGSTIFIIDPLYTVPLLVGVLSALLLSRRAERGHRINYIGLILSTLYLSWSVAAKFYVDQHSQHSLARQGIDYHSVLSIAAPFNTVLWRLVVLSDDYYYEGYYSLLDQAPDIRLTRYEKRPELLSALQNHWPVERLAWFTKGFYKAELKQTDIVITDLRMGVEPDYVFSFKVGEMIATQPQPTASQRLPSIRNFDRVPIIIRRIWDESAF